MQILYRWSRKAGNFQTFRTFLSWHIHLTRPDVEHNSNLNTFQNLAQLPSNIISWECYKVVVLL